MTISFPRIGMLDGIGFSGDPLLLVQQQEVSRMASGIAIGKDLGPAIWQASFVTEPLPNARALELEADLGALDGVINPFEAYDLRRPAPRYHADGSALDGVLASVASNKVVGLTGLAAGQLIAKGDYLSFDFAGGRRALHRVSSDTLAANGAGTATIEVRPHLCQGWTLGLAINLRAPRGLFILKPGSVAPKQYNGTQCVVSFAAVQIP